jgi:hypothetical protein
MTSRRRFLSGSAALAGALLPLPAAAQAPWGRVHELSGEVFLNGAPMAPNTAVQGGQTVSTGASGKVWFSIAGDAYFLRPRSELRLQSSNWRESVIDALRLVTGAMGATFRPGAQRSVFALTATIGIRGTGVYVDTTPEETYACTCFGSTEMYSAAGGAMMEAVRVMTENHLARRIHRDPTMGMRIVSAPFERHTNEEIARLEQLAGRPSPFRS